VIRYDTRL